MKRLALLSAIFALALALGLGLLVHRAYRGIEHREQAELRLFSQALLDALEEDAARFIREEENRPARDYELADPGQPSPLADGLGHDFVLAYVQAGPEGILTWPGSRGGTPPKDLTRTALALTDRLGPSGTKARNQEAERLTRELLRTRERESRLRALAKKRQTKRDNLVRSPGDGFDIKSKYLSPDQGLLESLRVPDAHPPRIPSAHLNPGAETGPLQSMTMDGGLVFLYRLAVSRGRVFRQGLIMDLGAYLERLAGTYFREQPMADFAGLTLIAAMPGGPPTLVSAGAKAKGASLDIARALPRPLSFVTARLACDAPPPAPGRGAVNAMALGVGAVVLLGLGAVYWSAKVAVEASRRRQGFVSSVTHELKTPLTSISMYAEMLEQGVAASPDAERRYLGIIASEAARLGRLISNVLEFARLETRQKRLNRVRGNFSEVVREVRTIMGARLDMEGFAFNVGGMDLPEFSYDREIMIQALINLMENSIKFGRLCPEKKITLKAEVVNGRAEVAVADTGPGIPAKDLVRIFDDFYRVDAHLTTKTSGTGIGLALVRRYAGLMGGTVRADNNIGPGCTVTISLPMDETRES